MDDWVGSCALTAPELEIDRALPHESWDLDFGDVRSWLRAQRVCLEQCPVLQQCEDLRDRLYRPSRRRPAGVIWAGVAYSDSGKVLDMEGLRRLSATLRSRRSTSFRVTDASSVG